MKSRFFILAMLPAFLVLTACNKLPSTCEKVWDLTIKIGKERNPELSSKQIDAEREKFENFVKAQGEQAEERCKVQLDMIKALHPE